MAKANLKDAPTPKKALPPGGGKLKRSEDPMVLAAEALIVKGKEQGFLSPDDILAGFPDVELDPDQLFRIFNVFRDMGVEVSDGEKDFEEVVEIDDDLIATIEAMDSVSLDDPVRMYLKEIGRVALLKAEQEVTLAKEIGDEMGISAEKVREIVKVSQDPVSLETPIGEEEDSHLGDFVEDKDATSPSDAASLTMLRTEVEDILDTLTPRERRVLQLRFGLIDGHQRTLEEVGKRFGVTRERIRQIEAKALRKLRHPSRSKKLKDYLQ